MCPWVLDPFVMSRSTRIAIVLAAVVLLAGCTGTGPGTLSSSTGTDAGTQAGSGQHATMHFYVSDQPNAIDDFAHLNVTIDRVVLIRAEGDADDDMDDDSASTGTPNGTSTAPTAVNATKAHGSSDAEQETGASGRVTFDVEERAVDLTTLQGTNATLLSEFDVPAGTYTAVYLGVSEVNGTLTTGEQVNVKLPSEKLQLTKSFEVGANESIDFVFDIGVHEAGKSGKYILRPVIDESGSDVPIDRVDRTGRPVGEDERERDDEAEDDESEHEERDGGEDAEFEHEDALSVSLLGTATVDENATIEVTEEGSAVANATVFLDDEAVGTTDGAGRLTVAVPADADSLDLEVVAGEAEGELEVEFEEDDDGEERRQDDDRREDDERSADSNDDPPDEESEDDGH